jgi:alpha-mannosidase
MCRKPNWRSWLKVLVWTFPMGWPLAVMAQDAEPVFTPLVELPAPKILAHAEEYPDRMFGAEHLVDGWGHTEFATNGQGTKTFVDFDLSEPKRMIGFRHQDRQDIATIARSELLFSNQPDFHEIQHKEVVKHVNRPGGITVAAFASPVTARYVRWQVTEMNAGGAACLGGADLRFLAGEEPDSTLIRNEVDIKAAQAILRSEGQPTRPVDVTIKHVYAEPAEVSVHVANLEPVSLKLTTGTQSVQVMLPASEEEIELPISIDLNGHPVVQKKLKVPPVRRWEFCFLPHSHNDIGYTHVQTEVEQRQWDHLEQAIQIARNTADYPSGAQFKWNCEVLWAVDSYLAQADEQKKNDFLEAVRKGWIHLDGLYGNELTALCRPEELMELTGCARRISQEYDLVIDSAMISDVPGYTWGIVPVMVQSGIKYLSIGPNHIHRIGRTLDAWGDRPFWWVSPSGQERLLCWMAGKAYSWFHDSRVGVLKRDSDPEPFLEYLNELMTADYPYDMIQVRYSIGGDNGPPDQELCEFVRRWNETYVWPRMQITTTSQLMHEFEHRYGDELPEVRGDFTPYWEDGAASSAKETSMTRTAAERLVQAEKIWSLRAKDAFPDKEFSSAWREILLYDEHTWGAHCSISQPNSEFTLSQWAIKQDFAEKADQLSRELLDRACDIDDRIPETVTTVDVYNTNSWTRTDLVVLKSDMRLAGHVVRDSAGREVPCQLVRQDQLAFLAKDVPPLGAKRFHLEKGESAGSGSVRINGLVISNDSLRVELDPNSGAIASLKWQPEPQDFVDTSEGAGLGQYHYVAGRDPANVESIESVAVREVDSGGLIGSLVASGQAPGCQEVRTWVRLIDGLDRVDVTVVLNKDDVLDKEAVHIGFPFNVPDGVMRVDIPWAVIRPNVDQLPGACKNYLTVGRWVDVSNDQLGITWTTRDAPLIEVGGIHMDVDKPFGAEHWIEQLEPTQTLYSYVMNNYWETNYKASQAGWVAFHYSLMPHGPFDQAEAARFGMERSQPLVAVPVDPEAAELKGQLVVEPASVVVTSMKPSQDGQATVVRLFNAGQRTAATQLKWTGAGTAKVVWSSPFGEAGDPVAGPIELPPLGVATVRVSH